MMCRQKVCVRGNAPTNSSWKICGCNYNWNAIEKWYYGPRADRLASSQDLAQALLEFAEQLDEKAISPEDVPSKAEPAYELRRVKRRPGRRHLANFEKLPVTT